MAKNKERAAPSPPRWQTAVLGLALVAITLAVFAPVRQFDFVQADDPQYVSENLHIAGGLSLEGIVWAFTTAHAGFWIPAVWISYMFDVTVLGPGAGGHHVTNLVLHAFAALLLFGWLYQASGARARSWAVAALFAVHPLHVESVAWITERKDVLSAVFWMAALWAYTLGVQGKTERRLVLVGAMFALGLMSKPMVVTLPLVLLLIDIWPLGRPAQLTPARLATGSSNRQRATSSDTGRVGKPTWKALRPLFIEKLPLLVIALVGGVVTFIAQGQAGAVGSVKSLPVGLRVGNALVSCVDYLRLTVWPAGLAAFYSLPTWIPAWEIIGAVVLLVGVTGIVLVQGRRRPYLAVGWFWFVVMLLPVSGLFQVGVQARADRFTYLPSIGLFVMATWGVADALPRRRWRTVALAALTIGVVAACGVAARAQVWHWKDSVAMWTRVAIIDQHLDEYTAHMELGSVLRGERRFAEARAHFAEAIRLKPESADPHVNLGLTLLIEGHRDQATVQYAEAVRLQPELPVVRNSLGALFAEQGRVDEAIAQFRAATALDPNFELAHVNLGSAYARARRVDEAIGEFREALRLNPNNALARRAFDALTAARPIR